MRFASITIIIILTVAFLIPLLIGIYVFRDAKRRGMNAFFWTVIAVLAPSLIGFIIYLLVRGNYSDLRCSRCETPVTNQYVVCPRCGAKLRPSCPSCATPIEADWKICPKCAQPLPEYQDDIVIPIRPKDKTIWKILAVVIIIPVLLFIIMVPPFLLNFSGSAGTSSLTTVPIDLYDVRGMKNGEIEEWIESVGNEYDKAYVLKYQTESGDDICVCYLIYLPQLAANTDHSFGIDAGLFGETLKINFQESDSSGGNTLVIADYMGNSNPKLKIYYDGKRLDCEITEIDYPIWPDNPNVSEATSTIQQEFTSGSLTIMEESEIIIKQG